MSRKQKAALAVGIALLLWLPTTVSTQTQPVVTGHSTFYNGNGYDPCLASIAGIIRNRVMWFNDQVLVESYGGKGTWIYMTEHNGTDPTSADQKLYTDGVFYDFVDPNGAHWHVEEDYLWNDIGYTPPSVGRVGGADPSSPLNSDPNSAPVNKGGLDGKKQYVWAVELAASPIHDQFAGAADSGNYHDIYNFLLLVDTCKMNQRTSLDTLSNDPHPETRNDDGTFKDNGTLYHDASCDCLTSGYGHPNNAVPHTHKVFLGDLYVGTQPTAIPAGASSTSAQYTSSWAVGNNGENLSRSENYASRAPNNTPTG